jgi:putative ABC transport system permease protein
MELPNTLRIALRAIRRNKVRSTLTMLGVIIGVASVIAMIALGSGASSVIDAQMQAQGTNIIYLSAGSHRGPGMAHGGAGSVSTLTLDDAQAVAQIPTVGRMSPSARGRAQVVAGNQNWSTQVEGGNEEYVVIRNWVIRAGSNFTSRDVLTADKVCLLGDTVASSLFPNGDDPVGQVIRIKNMPFRVLGVLAPKGQGQWGQDQDDLMIAPYTTVMKKLSGSTSLGQVVVSAARPEVVEQTAVEITRLMRQRHRVQRPEDDDFQVRTLEEMAATRTAMAETMTALLMSVASVSLLVGGIGIMNIMLVSVTERTKEIGLRMAVGARTRDILRQFLTEAVSLSVVGGSMGILLGIAVSQGLTRTLGWPTTITSSSILIAFAFAAGVGIFFGYYPARKAAGLDPIDALRYE